MVASASGEWIWRPLINPNGTLTTSFTLPGVKGFGLMQRDRRFSSYEDVEARYEMRPSAWVEPTSDWGPGRVELMALPTPDETHDNIVAYWVPAKAPAPGQPRTTRIACTCRASSSRSAGRLGGADPHRLQLRQARSERAAVHRRFEGPSLATLPAGAEVKAVASTNANGQVTEVNAYPNPSPAAGAWPSASSRSSPGSRPSCAHSSSPSSKC
ncbi:periplasmic glucan biosynthesis protein, mdoG domain-containing protein [Ditylenchus destructor]|nr:periplasmic glucan biosynthesis protein, mdoG domain-containing protein [Ditylenchus destructor]